MHICVYLIYSKINQLLPAGYFRSLAFHEREGQKDSFSSSGNDSDLKLYELHTIAFQCWVSSRCELFSPHSSRKDERNCEKRFRINDIF